MSDEKLTDQRFRRYGWMLLGVGGLWFAAMTWLYYNPPENAMQIAISIAQWLPHIAGIKNLSELNIWGEQFGDRIALVLAVSYVPMFVLGVFLFLTELWAGGITKRMLWHEYLYLLPIFTTIIGGAHYFFYWTDMLGYGRRLSIMIPLMAIVIPAVSSGLIAVLITSFKRLQIKK